MRGAYWRRMVVALLLGVGVIGPAHAQSGHPVAVIAVIDSNKIIRDSRAGQSVAEQIQTFADKFQGLVKREEEALRQQQQELRKQGSLLAQEVLEQRRLELERSFDDAQRLVQDRRAGIDETRQNALEVIRSQVLEIIDILQQERNFNLVLDQSVFSWRAPDLDITADVIARLDQRLPEVKVKRPKGF